MPPRRERGSAEAVSPPQNGKPLPRRQRLILEQLERVHPDPVQAGEAGALIHHGRGRHGADARCQWCAHEGAEVLRRLAQLGYAIRRKGAPGWTVRNVREAEPAASVVSHHVPGDPFEGL